MKKIIDIKYFIYTGLLYKVKVGMNRHEIISLIGIPDWFGLGNDDSYMTSDMWTYGNIELYFNYEIPGKDKLGMIFTDNLYNLDGGNTFDIDTWIFKQEENSEIELDYFLSIFNKKYILKQTFDDQILLLTTNGVTIAFNKDDSKLDNKFYAFSIYSHFSDLK